MQTCGGVHCLLVIAFVHFGLFGRISCCVHVGTYCCGPSCLTMLMGEKPVWM